MKISKGAVRVERRILCERERARECKKICRGSFEVPGKALEKCHTDVFGHRAGVGGLETRRCCGAREREVGTVAEGQTTAVGVVNLCNPCHWLGTTRIEAPAGSWERGEEKNAAKSVCL